MPSSTKDTNNTKIEDRDFASAYSEEVATFKILKKFGYQLIKSKGNNSVINNKEEKRNLSEQLPNNNEYKNMFSKYVKNDLPVNKSKNSEIQKIKIKNYVLRIFFGQ